MPPLSSSSPSSQSHRNNSRIAFLFENLSLYEDTELAADLCHLHRFRHHHQKAAAVSTGLPPLLLSPMKNAVAFGGASAAAGAQSGSDCPDPPTAMIGSPGGKSYSYYNRTSSFLNGAFRRSNLDAELVASMIAREECYGGSSGACGGGGGVGVVRRRHRQQQLQQISGPAADSRDERTTSDSVKRILSSTASPSNSTGDDSCDESDDHVDGFRLLQETIRRDCGGYTHGVLKLNLHRLARRVESELGERQTRKRLRDEQRLQKQRRREAERAAEALAEEEARALALAAKARRDLQEALQLMTTAFDLDRRDVGDDGVNPGDEKDDLWPFEREFDNHSPQSVVNIASVRDDIEITKGYKEKVQKEGEDRGAAVNSRHVDDDALFGPVQSL